MSQIIQIIQTEHERSDDNRNVIHLYQEGSFYRAYNWSAWLCHRFVHQFKVTHKNLKGIEDSVLFVGFPITSIDKYFGSFVVSEVSEKTKDVSLPDNIVTGCMDMDIMQTDFDIWKDSIPLTVSQVKHHDDEKNVSAVARTNTSPKTLTAVMQQILAFPLEQKTPIQCMLFIAETKQQLASMI